MIKQFVCKNPDTARHGADPYLLLITNNRPEGTPYVSVHGLDLDGAVRAANKGTTFLEVCDARRLLSFVKG